MTNCLADTGVNIWVIVLASFAVIIIAIATMVFPKLRRSIGGLMVAAMFMLSFVAVPAHAAAACGMATADTPTGTQGMILGYSVLKNDTPSTGSSFVLSSLKLSLTSTPVAGSTVSADGKTVTVPGEGAYVAGNDGIITFTPLASFVGKATGVIYTITDTSSASASSLFQPTITGTAAAAPVATNDVMGTYCASNPDASNLSSFAIYGNFTYCMGIGYYWDTQGSEPIRNYLPVSIANITDTTDGTIQNTWSSHLLANDTSSLGANPTSVDIDLSTTGVQQSITGAGFTAVYAPATDTLTVTITDVSLYAPYANPSSSTSESSPNYIGASRNVLNGIVLTYQYADTAGTISNIGTVTQPGYQVISTIQAAG